MGVHILLKSDPQFNKISTKIISHATKLCLLNDTLAVSNDYIKNFALNSADGLIVHYRTRGMTDFNGFLIFKIMKDYLYIDVICAKGSGTALLNECYSFAKKLNKPQVRLSALAHVINLYRKQGFIHSEGSCNMSNDVKSLSEALAHKRFKTTQNAIEDGEFKKLLQMLIKKKLTSTKKCKNIQDCSMNGYSMTKCL